MQPVYVSKTLVPGSSNGIGSISSGQSSAATLNSSQLDTGRRILVSASSNGSTSAFITIVGTREGGTVIQETVTGPSSTVAVNTLQDFISVTSISASSALQSQVLVGTSSIGGTQWKSVNYQISPFEMVAGITMNSGAVLATASGTIEHTFDDPFGFYPNPLSGANGSTRPANIGVPSVWVSTSLQGITAAGPLPFWSPFPSDTFAPFAPIAAWRLTITSTSSAAAIFATVIQSGIG